MYRYVFSKANLFFLFYRFRTGNTFVGNESNSLENFRVKISVLESESKTKSGQKKFWIRMNLIKINSDLQHWRIPVPLSGNSGA
jgi:hypothetical protein